MHNMVKRREWFSFLQLLASSSPCDSNDEYKNNVIKGIHFSNIGWVDTEYYKDVQLGMCYSTEKMNNIETFVFTYNK